jgi:hypothetical protein
MVPAGSAETRRRPLRSIFPKARPNKWAGLPVSGALVVIALRSRLETALPRSLRQHRR